MRNQRIDTSFYGGNNDNRMWLVSATLCIQSNSDVTNLTLSRIMLDIVLYFALKSAILCEL